MPVERFIKTSWARSSSARRAFSRASFWAGSRFSSSSSAVVVMVASAVGVGASSVSDMRGEKDVRRGS